MKSIASPSVALIEWNWFGHIPGWYEFYCAALLKLGCTITAFCPKPEEVRMALASSPLVEKADLARLILKEIPKPRIPLIRPARFQTRLDDYMFKRTVRRMLGAGRFDLIFFSCLHEDMATAARRWKNIGHRAAALMINATGPAQASEPLPCGDLDTFVVLDEDWATRYREAFPNTRFVCFPDLTVGTESKADPVGAKLRKLANGRPIILLPGMLNSYKGVASFARLPFHPAMAGNFFVMAGTLPRDQYSAADLAAIDRFQAATDRAYTHFEHISDSAYNAFVDSSTVIYAVYQDFRKSSNTLTKAALYGKPVIVAEGEVMAARTRTFRLGEVVRAGDGEALVKAITNLTANPEVWVSNTRPRWEEYLQMHSFQRLVDAFREVLG